MNAPATINAALTARGMLPIDGYCVCARCGRDDLDRDDIDPRGADAPYPIGYKVEYYGGRLCKDCCESEEQEHLETRAEVERIKSGGTTCPHHQEALRIRDHARGHDRTEWCSYCNGYSA